MSCRASPRNQCVSISRAEQPRSSKAGATRRSTSTCGWNPRANSFIVALPKLKDSLRINIELASPPDFIPELPGWRDRSPVVFTDGSIEVRHFDPYSQALSKIERGFAQYLEDVEHMLGHEMIGLDRLLTLYDAIEPELFRYPAIDPTAFRRKVEAITED